MSLSELMISLIANGTQIVNQFGYIGIFLISLIGSTTIIFPLPSFFLIFTFGGILNPVLVALFAAIGSAIGESTSYILGLGGKELLEKKYKKQLNSLKKAFDKYGSFIWIIIFTITPFPTDVVGIFSGIIKYNFRKYFLAMFIGKFILYLLIAIAGFFSIHWILEFFTLSGIL